MTTGPQVEAARAGEQRDRDGDDVPDEQRGRHRRQDSHRHGPPGSGLVPAFPCDEHDRDDDEQQRNQSRKQVALGTYQRLQPGAPEPQLVVRREPAEGVCAVVHDHGHRAGRLAQAPQLQVRVQERRRQGDADDGGDERSEPGARVTHAPPQQHLGDDVRRQPQRRVDEEVAVGQVLRGQRDPRENGVPHPPRLPPLVQAPQHEREPLGGEDLQVRPLVHAVEREPVEQAGHEPGQAAAREAADEQEGAHRRQHERRQEQQVVRQDDVTRQCVDGRPLERLRDQQLRLAEAVR